MGYCINEEDKGGVGDEEIDISDSEIKEYKEAVHKLLKFRNYKVRTPNGEFVCPFCVGEEKQGYYRLLEHAVRVAEGSTGSAKQRTNHSAIAKYLVIDLAGEAERPSQSGSKMQQDMLNLDFEKKRQRLSSWEEDLNKREAALTEEKRKMDALMREKNDVDLSYQHHVAEKGPANDELLEAGKKLMKRAGKRKAALAPKADKRNSKKAMKDRNKPKLPPNGFFVFMEEFRDTFKKEHPNKKSAFAVGKAGPDKWKSLSEAEKAPYESKAEKEREYEKLMNDYNKKQDSSGDEGSESSMYIEFDEDYACALGLKLNS